MPALGTLLPTFDGVPRWRGGVKPTDADLAGKAVLIHFFSSGCPLCSEGMPVVRRMREAFAASGLIVVGAYQPRPEATTTETEAEEICDRIVHGEYPCAADTGGVLALRFGHRWAPAYYVFDRAHRLRHFQEGNWNLNALEAVIRRSV